MKMKNTNEKKQSRFPKPLKRLLFVFLFLMLAGCLLTAGLNIWVTQTASEYIWDTDLQATGDCIIVLGAGLYGDKPSPMLEDRLKKGIELYKNNAAPKILMSGDHGRTGYNEVQVMKQYAIDAGVPSSDIFMDHAGFSTYESMIRARDIFEVHSPIIVTQKYHIYRAVFIGRHLDIDCVGVPTDEFPYGGQFYRNIRECIARCKDVVTVATNASPTYGGEKIPISGNGDVTND